jgi:hypothetical protein
VDPDPEIYCQKGMTNILTNYGIYLFILFGKFGLILYGSGFGLGIKQLWDPQHCLEGSQAFVLGTGWSGRVFRCMDQISIKTPNHKCQLFLRIDQ